MYIFNVCEDATVWIWHVQITVLSVGMDKKRSLQRKLQIRFLSVGMDKKRILQVNTRDELVARIMNSAALIKQARQDDLTRATRTVAKRVEKCIEVDGGIFNTYFEMLQFIEITYITNKCNQYVICLSFIPFVSLFMRNIQISVSPHPLKIGLMFIWTYLLGIVLTATS